MTEFNLEDEKKELLKRRLVNRLRNWTNNKTILKRFKRDLDKLTGDLK